MSDATSPPASSVPAPAQASASGAPAGESDDAVVAVVSLYQKQRKIYARAVTGLFATWRWSLVWFTQLLFYGLPWLSWNDRQLVLFDLGARRFYIGPLVLYPQDFIYLTAILIISAYALFLFTAVAGRLWCGYACPQTVYTEMFMWVERKIEGDRIARMRLDEGPWNLGKLWRKGAKQLAWVLIALWTGFTFVGYFTPIKTLAAAAVSLGFGPWEWFWVLFYGLATYGNAGFLREQVCKYMCPYARFQSAMFDKDTLIISYDAERGEPRGSRSKKADPAKLGLGSCIDCGLCVQVCPTGIDIRNGLQNECIGCAACIDVCDDVMDKMGYAPGLIRYATGHGMAEGLNRSQMLRRVLRPRVWIYGALLLAAAAAFVASLAGRAPLQVDILKDRGALARVVDDGVVENVYRLQVANRREDAQRLSLQVDGPPGLRLAADTPARDLALPGAGRAQWVLHLHLPPEAAQGLRGQAVPVRLHLAVRPDGAAPTSIATPAAAEVVEKTTFYVPR